MKFRIIGDDINKRIYAKIVSYNHRTLGINGNVPSQVGVSFAKLVSFYPMADSMEHTYFKLSPKRRVSFLFRYLVKTANKNNISRPIVKKLVDLKCEYDDVRNSKMSEKEFSDRMIMYMVSKDYEAVLDLYRSKDLVYNAYTDLMEHTKLVVDSLVYEKIKNIKKDVAVNQIIGRPQLGIESHRVRNYTIDDIKNDIISISDEVSEIDRFISSEVEKRLSDYFKNEKEKSSDNKSDEGRTWF